MRSGLWLVFIVALTCCEQRFSAAPPLLAPESAPSAVSSGALESLLTPAADDAGAEVAQARAMTVTLCSASAQPCEAAEGGASDGEAYRVVFGSGRAEIRSRVQAMTDLYKELRDRTTAGERLAAIPRAPRSSGGAFTTSGGASARASGGRETTSRGARFTCWIWSMGWGRSFSSDCRDLRRRGASSRWGGPGEMRGCRNASSRSRIVPIEVRTDVGFRLLEGEDASMVPTSVGWRVNGMKARPQPP